MPATKLRTTLPSTLCAARMIGFAGFQVARLLRLVYFFSFFSSAPAPGAFPPSGCFAAPDFEVDRRNRCQYFSRSSDEY
jgi:hypothetical protein